MSAIDLHDIGKRYLQMQGRDMLVRKVLTPWQRRGSELWALRNVSLSCEPGETLGVIGRNGSGKTTLLRLLSGVSAPTEGNLTVRGRIAPLIGIGVGFNAELTGRENVDVNGRLLGMTPAEVRRKFDSIVDFSEIEAFIDTPVKYYSSGMFLRLAFAIAIHTDPEVLLVDEVLAVGDLAFQLKCDARMREIQRDGATIVIVTHNLGMLDQMAPRTVLLSHGQVEYDGPTETAIGRYHELTLAAAEAERANAAAGDWTPGAAGASVEASIHAADGDPRRQFASGEALLVRAHVNFHRPVARPRVGLIVSPLGMGACYTTFTFPGTYRATHNPDRPLDIEIAMQNRLLSGSYTVRVGVFDEGGTDPIAMSSRETFYVTATGDAEGIVDLGAEIRMAGRVIRRPVRSRLGRDTERRVTAK